MNNDLNIKIEVQSDFDEIEKDFNDINDIINKVYRAMLTLDENIWKTKEKEVIDQDFMPYLKNYSEKYYNYLMIRLNLARKAVESHYQLDKENAKLSDIDEI